MNMSYCNRYVQIELLEGSHLLFKVMRYARKHFSKYCHLSSSFLILDDGERIKKDYLINWVYHSGLQEGKINLQELLGYSHLPIRIKIIKRNDLLQRVKISLRVVGLNKVILTLSNTNRVAKRYLKSLFGEYCVVKTDKEIHLNGTQEYFWKNIMDLIDLKVIHNIAIDFEYERFGVDSFLTQDERRLRQYYDELGLSFNDDFCSVKKCYLQLARTYHPDNVYGKDEHTIKDYQERFSKINEAYQAIKKVSEHAC